MTTVRMRYTGARPCLAQGQHLAPGDVVDLRPEVARYFTLRGEGELIPAEIQYAEPVSTHRDPTAANADPQPRKRR